LIAPHVGKQRLQNTVVAVGAERELSEFNFISLNVNIMLYLKKQKPLSLYGGDTMSFILY